MVSAVLSVFSFTHILLVFTFIGLAIPKTISNEFLNYFISAYIVLDVMLRLFFQRIKLETLNFNSLVFHRSSLVHFTLMVNSINIFSLIPIMLFVPVLFVKTQNPTLYIALLLMIVLCLNWMILFIHISNSPFLRPLVIGVSIVLLPLITHVPINFIEVIGVTSNDFVIIIGLIVTLFVYAIVFCYSKQKFLILKGSNLTKSKITIGKIDFFQHLLDLDIKLILRNKRPLTYTLSSISLLILLGITLDNDPNSIGIVDFVIFSYLSIIIFLQYGQYLFSWESGYFGFILHNIYTDNYISTKFKLFDFLMVLNGICLIPIVMWQGSNYYYFGIWLFQLGSLPMLVILISLRNTKPIKLNKGAFMNYEGTTLNTFILLFFCSLLPLLIYFPFYLGGQVVEGVYVLGFIGFILLFFRKKQIAFVKNIFETRKHLMYKGFRNI